MFIVCALWRPLERKKKSDSRSQEVVTPLPNTRQWSPFFQSVPCRCCCGGVKVQRSSTAIQRGLHMAGLKRSQWPSHLFPMWEVGKPIRPPELLLLQPWPCGPGIRTPAWTRKRASECRECPEERNACTSTCKWRG